MPNEATLDIDPELAHLAVRGLQNKKKVENYVFCFF